MHSTVDTMTGPAGSAERVRITRPPAGTSACDLWFCRLPKAHPFWSCYLLSIVHLRDLQGPDGRTLVAQRQYPEAAYELVLVALNPELRPVAGDMQTWQYLTPLNVCIQFHGASDAQIPAVAERLAGALVNGVLWAEPQGVSGAIDLWHRQIDRAIERVTGRSVVPRYPPMQ